MRRCFFLLLSLGFFPCCQQYTEQHISSCYTDGTPKPRVAILPVIDKSNQSLPWNLSEELTTSIQERLLQKEQLFLLLSKKGELSSSLPEKDFSWLKTTFFTQDFVVLIELLEHQELPLISLSQAFPKDAPAELKITLQLQVIDLRQEEPQVILQEVVQDTQYLPKKFTQYNFFQIPWGKENYNITPLGMAHAKLAKELSCRIEEHILLTAKSK